MVFSDSAHEIIAGLSAALILSGCGSQYTPPAPGPLHYKFIVAPTLAAGRLGSGYDSVQKKIVDSDCEMGFPVGRFRAAHTESFEPIDSVAVNPTRENVISALTNMSPVSRALTTFPQVQEFGDASTSTKKNLVSTRMVLIHSEIFSFGKDRVKNHSALRCADRFVSHIYAGAALAVSVKVDFNSTRNRTHFVNLFGVSAPFGPGDFSSQATEMSEEMTASGANLTFTVFQLGGDIDKSVDLLNRSRCEISNLDACSVTLSSLESEFKKGLTFPESPTRLGGFAITDFATSSYDAPK